MKDSDCGRWRKKIEQYVDVESKQPKGHENETPVYTELRDTVYSHTDHCLKCADFELQMRCKVEKIDLAEFPCVHVAYYGSVLCEVHDSGWDCTDVAIVVDEKGDWGLPVRDQEDGAAETMIRIRHCPWCGVELGKAKIIET